MDFGALQEGEYMLVETKTLAGYELPKGQWLLTVSRGSNGYGSYSFLVKGDETTPEFGWRTDVGTGIIAMGLPNEKRQPFLYPELAVPESQPYTSQVLSSWQGQEERSFIKGRRKLGQRQAVNPAALTAIRPPSYGGGHDNL